MRVARFGGRPICCKIRVGRGPSAMKREIEIEVEGDLMVASMPDTFLSSYFF